MLRYTVKMGDSARHEGTCQEQAMEQEHEDNFGSLHFNNSLSKIQ